MAAWVEQASPASSARPQQRPSLVDVLSEAQNQLTDLLSGYCR